MHRASHLPTIAFVLSILLAIAFPVDGQKVFVSSISMDGARELCEEYIVELEISHVSQVVQGEELSEWSLPVGEKTGVTGGSNKSL